MIQAESLIYREPQLVSVNNFEQLEAFNLGLVSPLDGTVMSIRDGGIRLKSRDKGTVAVVYTPKNSTFKQGFVHQF